MSRGAGPSTGKKERRFDLRWVGPAPAPGGAKYPGVGGREDIEFVYAKVPVEAEDGGSVDED